MFNKISVILEHLVINGNESGIKRINYVYKMALSEGLNIDISPFFN